MSALAEILTFDNQDNNADIQFMTQVQVVESLPCCKESNSNENKKESSAILVLEKH